MEIVSFNNNPIELTLIIYKNSFARNNFLAMLKVFLYFCKIMNDMHYEKEFRFSIDLPVVLGM